MLVPQFQNSMQSITEAPVTIYRHNTCPLLPTDDVSPLGSGKIFTDIVIIGDNNSAENTRTCPRVIKCVNNPLDDRDWGFLSVNWSAQRLESLRLILIEVQEFRKAYRAQQPEDHRRFGRREALAREHSIKIIGLAIADQQEDQERREARAGRTSTCATM